MSGMNPHEVADWKATPSRPGKRRPRAAFSYQESSWYVPAAASGSWTASAARCCSRTALPVLVVPMSIDLRVKETDRRFLTRRRDEVQRFQRRFHRGDPPVDQHPLT